MFAFHVGTRIRTRDLRKTWSASNTPSHRCTCVCGSGRGALARQCASPGRAFAGLNQSGAFLSLALDAHVLYLGAYEGLSSIWSRFPHLREHLVQDYQANGKPLFSFTGASAAQQPPSTPAASVTRMCLPVGL